MAYCTLVDLKDQIKEDDLAQITDDRVNLTSGVLNGAINAAITSITLNDSSLFPVSGRVQIGYELIDFVANSGTVLSGCTRGAGDTLADSHLDDSPVSEKNCINTAKIDRAIADADAEIDGYCATRYADLPFTAVPVMIRKISVDITLYNLYSRRRGAPEDRLQRYKDAIKFLVSVSNGTVTLGGDAPAEDDDAGPEATTVKSDRIFTRGRISDSSTGSLDNY